MYMVQSDAGLPNRAKAIERGKAMVAAGMARREVAIAIYDEYYWDKAVQPSQYQRRIRYLVEVLP
ncbi:hypothetical protein [Sphingobium fuliginis]|uniref:Uncharacterized protein n=1 Tax=Sphingobium fuliginis (strain ATCC 27551) TaxID=336203 RepID=A0A292ZEB3_SPHSA|nr:hypothetical protein [Sphingobium fuliginis]GAY21194.1 hypothetical protein SFOMI_1729 [Sphingobium fuliginis]